MGRRRPHAPLRVLLNNQLVGTLRKEAGGAIDFQYSEGWVAASRPIPVSLSLPVRGAAYKGEAVVAVFENLLPDSLPLRRSVAEKVGAQGTDAYSLLAQIGRDCVGALQFIPDGEDLPTAAPALSGEPLEEAQIERLLNNLARAPLGLGEDDDFRISVAGAQEKTALLWHDGAWLKPHGATPTSHILKTQIGRLPNGIDLSNSVENEYYCLKLLAAFGLPVNRAEMLTFGTTRALAIERFDRQWTAQGLMRLPQEDFCQALSVPPTLKYQNEGGPGMVDILMRLRASDYPEEDCLRFLKAQIIFWLIGATDGHAKNFSVYLGPGGSFSLTPFYDVLTAQPSLATRQIERKQMKLAMSVGNSRHYKIEEILPRHFVQTAQKAGLTEAFAKAALEEVAGTAKQALEATAQGLPRGFPARIHEAVSKAAVARLRTFAQGK